MKLVEMCKKKCRKEENAFFIFIQVAQKTSVDSLITLHGSCVMSIHGGFDGRKRVHQKPEAWNHWRNALTFMTMNSLLAELNAV